MLSSWSVADLDAIDAVDELHLASRRADGTLRRPRIVWVVRHGADLYVRSVNGPDSAWYRGVHTRREGHISAGGVEQDVAFADADHSVDDDLDAAYRNKYRRYAANIIDSINSPHARSTTLKLTPR